MTSPIERAAEAMDSLDDHRMYTTFTAFARAAFESVDVDELAQEIRRVDGNHDMGAGALAEAIRDHLTGGNDE